MKLNAIILVAVLLSVVGAGSFGIGYKVGQLKNSPTSFARNGSGQFANRGQDGNTRGGQNNGMMRGNRQVIGEVTSMDDKSITVKMIDGSSKIVLLSSSTTINKSVESSISELKVGSTVAVFGSQNTDGSQTATNIELNPRMPNLTSVPQK